VNTDAPISYTGAAQLVEVRYRLDALDTATPAALLVEGADDKRLFLPFVRHPALVVPCSGRRGVLATRAVMTVDDQARIVSLIDCDYEVARRNFTPSPGVVITGGTDVEADMFLIGLLDRIVQNLIPREITEPNELAEIADDIRSSAISLSTPLGRARMAAQPLGIELDLGDFSFSKHTLRSGEPDISKMTRTVHGRLEEAIGLDDFRTCLAETPDDPRLCKGDDLLAAAAFIIRSRYRGSNKVNAELLDNLLRARMADATVFEAWLVVRRIRSWEDRSGVTLLKPRLT